MGRESSNGRSGDEGRRGGGVKRRKSSNYTLRPRSSNPTFQMDPLRGGGMLSWGASFGSPTANESCDFAAPIFFWQVQRIRFLKCFWRNPQDL